MVLHIQVLKKWPDDAENTQWFGCHLLANLTRENEYCGAMKKVGTVGIVTVALENHPYDALVQEEASRFIKGMFG